VVGPLEDLRLADVNRTLEVNVRAPLLAARAGARYMTESGRIISIGSKVIERTPFAGMTLYARSRTALLGLATGLARDLGGAASPSTWSARAQPTPR